MAKDKMTVCKSCGAEIASSAKTCPKCGAKNKKPIYKRVWFWILAAILVLGIGGAAGGSKGVEDTSVSSNESTVTEQTAENSHEVVESNSKAKDSTADMTTEQKNAYKAAKNYVELMAFSKQKLIDQLSSEYGDNYPEDVAEYAVNKLEENGEVDWINECKEAAKNYLDLTSFSRDGLIDQLTSEYGDQYTQEEAEAAVDAVYQ